MRLFFASVLTACAPGSADPKDTATPDSAPLDSGVDTADSGSPDSGSPDSGSPDSGSPDSAGSDSGHPDTGCPEPCTFAGEHSVTEAEVILHGDTPYLDLGRVVRTGDLDGDGGVDLVAATFLVGEQLGGAYVFPGPVVSGDASSVGYRLSGEFVSSGAGRSLSVGDLDGDGRDDVGVGAPYARLSGMYVAFGPVTGDRDLADGALLLTPSGSYGGHGADIGDVDGEGIADGVVGAYYASSPSGTVYVANGPIAGDVDLAADADATLVGESGNIYAGRIVDAGSDLDGDGIGDIVIGCLGNLGPPASGGFYVVYGPPADMSLADADGRYAGESASDAAALWLSSGDVDGDGRADVVAASYDDTLARTAGAAFVVLGPATDHTDLSAADIIVRGDTAGQYGGGVAAEDLDGDGVAELLLGAQGDPTVGTNAGAAFLFWDPAPGSYVFGDADATFYAESAGDNLGVGLAAGDVDADGAPEIILGAPYEGTGGSGAGAVYVMGPG